jgi:hypothetical protein
LSCPTNLLFLTLLIDVSEDIIQNKVSGRLLRKDEGLDEFLELSRFVGCLADDLNDDVVDGSLRINVGDSDFAVLEIEFLDALLDGLNLFSM